MVHLLASIREARDLNEVGRARIYLRCEGSPVSRVRLVYQHTPSRKVGMQWPSGTSSCTGGRWGSADCGSRTSGTRPSCPAASSPWPARCRRSTTWMRTSSSPKTARSSSGSAPREHVSRSSRWASQHAPFDVTRSHRVDCPWAHWSTQLPTPFVSHAGSGGFTASQLTNVGRLLAHGWELGANGFVVNRPKVALDLFANGSYLWQKVASLGGSPPIKVTPGYVRVRQFIKEGYAPGSLFGAKILQPCASYRDPANDAKGGCLDSLWTFDNGTEGCARRLGPGEAVPVAGIMQNDEGLGGMSRGVAMVRFV